MQCLVTKLASAVNNSSLPTFDTIQVEYQANESFTYYIGTSGEDIVAKIVEGTCTFGNVSSHITKVSNTEILISNDTNANFKLVGSGDCTIEITNKQYLTKLSHVKNISTEDLSGLASLIEMDVYTNLGGSIGLLATYCPLLENILVDYNSNISSVTGKFSDLASLPLRTFKLNKIRYMTVDSIENYVAQRVKAGTTTSPNSIRVGTTGYTAGSDPVTFQGSGINKYAGYLLSWEPYSEDNTKTSITFNSVTVVIDPSDY